MPKARTIDDLPFPLRVLRFLMPFFERFLPFIAKNLAVKFFYFPLKIHASEKQKAFIKTASRIRKLDYKGGKFNLYEWGTGQQYVLFIHGWAGRAAQFRKIIPELVAQGIPVKAIDAPGHGDSDKQGTSIFAFAESLTETVEEFGSPAVCIGHSLGGVASILAQLKGMHASALVSISAPVITEDVLDSFVERMNLSKKAKNWLKSAFEKRHQMPFDEFSGLRLAEKLQEMPFLICHDQEDREVGIFHSVELHKRIPFAQVYYTSGQGHVRILSDNKLIQQLSTFCRQHLPSV